MNYRIVATLGPATGGEESWRGLLEAGATAFRLNTAHFRLEILQAWLERISGFLEQSGAVSSGSPEHDGSAREGPFPVILDLQASKWRIGTVRSAQLEEGASVRLIPAEAQGEELESAGSGSRILPVPHPDFFTAAGAAGGGEIAVNDAKVMLRIERLEKNRIAARVIRSGEISAGKGITLVGSGYRKEQLNRKDRRVVELTRSYPFVRYALSYVKDAVEMSNYRRLFPDSTYLIAKVERASALEEAEPIARSADELWICRGDLGAEMGAAAMAEQLFRFFPRIPKIPKPVFLAGQVLEHLTANPTPTRSEISCLYESLQRGFRGFVLSDETAVGAHPLEACRVAALFRSR
jgi:pyruvate kinase